MRAFDITAEPRVLGAAGPRLVRIGLALGLVGLGAALVFAASGAGGIDRFLHTYLISFAFFLSLALGALFFVLLQHVTRAGWSVVVRRLAEGIALNVGPLAILALPIVLGLGRIYPWDRPEEVAGDALLAAKAGFLNPTFFVVRLVVYFAIWFLLARRLFALSTAQDASGDPALTVRLERLSAPGLAVYALTVNFAAFDLLMSLDAHWFSTIFGVYLFAAAVVGLLALLPLVLLALQRSGRLPRAVTIEHYHDLGKLLFAFVVFWAYIAFSQYMLIWYGNLPEETEWFLKRQSGGWTGVSLALLFGHFLVPFLVLVSRYVKRRPRLLAATGLWMLVMCWLDIYWLAMPELSGGAVVFGPVDILCFVGLGGLNLAAVAWRLGRCSLVPEGDPRLGESLAFETA